MLQALGELTLRQRDYRRAALWLEESLALHCRLGDRRGVAASLGTLGAVVLRQGDSERARELLCESLEMRAELGDKGGMAWCLEHVAEAIVAEGSDPEDAWRAARILGAAQALREATGSMIDPVDHPGYERVVAAVRAQLSGEAFTAAWVAGRAMTLEQAIAHAVEKPAPASMAPRTSAGCAD